MYLLLWLSGWLLFMAAAERAVHRYVQHRWLFRLNFTHVWFFRHAVLHHRDGRNDLNVDLESSYVLYVAGPIIAAAACFDLGGAVVLAAGFLFYGFLWTKLHRAIHDIENNWARRLWCYPAIERHHLAHHRQPGRNFGAVFFFTDRIFGTCAVNV